MADMAPDERTGTVRRVGELAAATGLTVRTLHYYEEIGLLVASHRSDSGHRLYGGDDVQRLYQICLLRRLGLPLGEITRALDDPAWDLHTAMARHLADLDERLDATGRLRGRLAQLLGSGELDGALTDDLLAVLEAMTMLDTTSPFWSTTTSRRPTTTSSGHDRLWTSRPAVWLPRVRHARPRGRACGRSCSRWTDLADQEPSVGVVSEPACAAPQAAPLFGRAPQSGGDRTSYVVFSRVDLVDGARALPLLAHGGAGRLRSHTDRDDQGPEA